MSEFKYHTSCPNCGSSDARAVYQGGSSWCFSCHSFKRGEINAELFRNKESSKKVQALPDDLGKSYSPEVVAWAKTYSIEVPELIRRGVCYSERQLRLYFIWRDGEEKTIAWQARNFSGKGPKYSSSGSLEAVYPIYCSEDNQRSVESGGKHGLPVLRRSDGILVLVEDCMSAIKIARQSDAMPCLTSSLSPTKLNRLVRLYDTFVVWLDGNMFPNAQKMARQLQMLGADARAVYTPLDPKCYDDGNIRNILLTGKLL